MKKHTLYIYVLVAVSLAMATLCSCTSGDGNKRKAAVVSNKECPTFVADSAFRYIEEQCAFGPRIPGTKEADACAAWIKERFAAYGCTVEEQKTQVTVWDGSVVPCRNIVASVNPQAQRRILLCAHWDTRPWADNDPDEANHRRPIDGANDGASGVAVMMEMARQIQSQPLDGGLGVDFVCFDVEDMGIPQWAEDRTDVGDSDTWCLGSKAWAEQAARTGYTAQYGILLDMVGGRGASFAREQVSMHFASHVVGKVWSVASSLGYGQFFPGREGGMLVDDHVNLNTVARIPCIDIVPYYTDGPSSFGPTWHTVCDTPANIDPNVLEAVGQTVLQVLYNEQTI